MSVSFPVLINHSWHSSKRRVIWDMLKLEEDNSLCGGEIIWAIHYLKFYQWNSFQQLKTQNSANFYQQLAGLTCTHTKWWGFKQCNCLYVSYRCRSAWLHSVTLRTTLYISGKPLSSHLLTSLLLSPPLFNALLLYDNVFELATRATATD